MLKMQTQKILILGGGFGGVKAALELCHNKNFEISLLSERDDFRFYPALFMTAMGGSKACSSIPLAEIFNRKSIELIQDSAVKLDRAGKFIAGKSGQIYHFDHLIVALGSITNFFGTKGLEEYSYGIKSVDQAQQLRDHIHKSLIDQHQPEANYVVIGGGPTGVELAGMLGSYIKHVLKAHKLPVIEPHIDLVEAAPRLMPRLSEGYSKAVCRRLTKLGVQLYLGQKVEGETADALMVNGHSISSHTVVWTAGVALAPFVKDNGFKLDDHGKVVVDAQLQAEPGVFVIGDNASTPYSGMAQTAIYDAKFMANNLKLSARGKTPVNYKPVEPAYVTPVGPHWAAFQWRSIKFYGKLGWLMRRAADLVAYHDLESWPKAFGRWRAESQRDNYCPDCQH